MLFIFILIVTGVFMYVQFLLIQKDEINISEEVYSKQYQCHVAVEGKSEAIECFNNFFDITLDRLASRERGEEVPKILLDIYSEVKKEEIYTTGGGIYRIDRGGFDSPYFIEDGNVFIDRSR